MSEQLLVNVLTHSIHYTSLKSRVKFSKSKLKTNICICLGKWKREKVTREREWLCGCVCVCVCMDRTVWITRLTHFHPHACFPWLGYIEQSCSMLQSKWTPIVHIYSIIWYIPTLYIHISTGMHLQLYPHTNM